MKKQNEVSEKVVYTIEDLAEGRCSLKNDGTIEELQLVLDKAFPKDKSGASGWLAGISFQKYNEDTDWIQIYAHENYRLLPMQSCSVFLAELSEADEEINGVVSSEELSNYKDDCLDFVAQMREFSTGATRNKDEDKLDFEGFLSPLALEEFAKYMHKNRMQADGKLRDSDNWQKGIPIDAYMSSMWRHFFDTWKRHRGLETPEDQISNLCGLMFNVQGMLHELLKQK